MSELVDPLTFAVQDIVEGSGLFQTKDQFLPISNLKQMRNMPEGTVWPQVSAYTSTVSFTQDTITKELAVMVYFPFPTENGVRTGIEYDDNIAILIETETYVTLLMDMVDWLIGKHKIDTGRKGGGQSAYGFTLEGEATITPMFFDETGTQQEKKEYIHDLVAVLLMVNFSGSRASLSPTRMEPKLSGTSRDNALLNG